MGRSYHRKWIAGCKSADYHHQRAKRDARELHLGDAMREEHRANVEQHRADETR